MGFNPFCLQHSSLPQLHNSSNVSSTVGNILRTPFSGCLIASSSNLVRGPPLPKISVISEFSCLGNTKTHTVRDLWWVWRLLQLSSDVFGQKLLHKMWSVCACFVVVQDPVTIPPFFRSFSANWFMQTSQDLHVSLVLSISCYCERLF